MKAVFRVLAVGVAALVACGGRSQNQKDSSEDGAGEGGGGTGGSRGGQTGNGGTGGPLGGTNGNNGGAPGGTTAFGGTTAVGGSAGAPGGTAGAPGGTTAFGGTGGTGIAGQPNGFAIEPDENGCVWRDAQRDSPVQGCFYVFGDQYPSPSGAKCIMPGMHRPAECSIIESPTPPPALGFPQLTPGVMCTTGTAAQVLPCAPTVMTSGCPQYDYENMWGAGTGFDFNADKGEDGGAKHPWDPALAVGGPYVGFSFDIDTVPLGGLRVEVPIVLTDEEAARSTPPLPSGSTTDDHRDGSPYWGATSMYPNSPVIPGRNRVIWSAIRPPRPENYSFDTTRMLSVYFHVTTSTASRNPYSFCISNLTLLRE